MSRRPSRKSQPEERCLGAFLQGCTTARLGLPDGLNIIETADGPIEGIATEDGFRWELPDGRVLEAWGDSEGGTRYVLDGHQVARLHSVTVEPDDEPVEGPRRGGRDRGRAPCSRLGPGLALHPGARVDRGGPIMTEEKEIVDEWDEDHLRALDNALRESAIVAGALPFFDDDREGLIPEDEPEATDPFPTDPGLRELALRSRVLEQRLGELPEDLRWIARADWTIEEGTVTVASDRVKNLGTWTEAEFAELIRRYIDAAG